MPEARLILIVDDTPEVLDVVSEMLRERGFRVMVAFDGEHAVQVAHAGPQPDFIIMDFALPRIDGLEATRRLKADARTRHIPVLLFTAHMGTEMRMRAEEAGCLGVLGKLDGASGLFDAIDRATLPAAAPIPAP